MLRVYATRVLAVRASAQEMTLASTVQCQLVNLLKTVRAGEVWFKCGVRDHGMSAALGSSLIQIGPCERQIRSEAYLYGLKNSSLPQLLVSDLDAPY